MPVKRLTAQRREWRWGGSANVSLPPCPSHPASAVTLQETQAQCTTCQASKKTAEAWKPPPLTGRAHGLPLPLFRTLPLPAVGPHICSWKQSSHHADQHTRLPEIHPRHRHLLGVLSSSPGASSQAHPGPLQATQLRFRTQETVGVAVSVSQTVTEPPETPLTCTP